MIDFGTRYPDAVPLRKIDVATVADALMSVFSRVGLPQEILSDQGSNFMSNLMKEVLSYIQIQYLTTSQYHPQCDGMLERFHATIMRKGCPARKEWDQWLPFVLFAARNAVHSATGFSPFELLFGRAVRGPLSIVK